MSRISIELQNLRLKKGMNQSELARRVNCSRNHICEIERGDGQPSLTLLLLILDELGYELCFRRKKVVKKSLPEDEGQSTPDDGGDEEQEEEEPDHPSSD